LRKREGALEAQALGDRPVVAEEAGTKARFLVENEEPIMAGQPLVEMDG